LILSYAHYVLLFVIPANKLLILVRGWQQSSGGGYCPRQPGQTNSGYNEGPHQQFQQPSPPQPSAAAPQRSTRTVTVIRMADGTYGIVDDYRRCWSTYWKIRLAVAAVSVVIIIPLIIIFSVTRS